MPLFAATQGYNVLMDKEARMAQANMPSWQQPRFSGGIYLKKRTKLISLLAGLAALPVVASVPAFGEGSGNFILVSNRDFPDRNISLTEHRQDGTEVRSGTFTIKHNDADYWIIGAGDYVTVTGPFNFSEAVPATSIPRCYRIEQKSGMYYVPNDCNTSGAKLMWQDPGPP
jgi:hypothetical protein